MATEVMEREQAADEPHITRRRASIEEFWALPESVLPIEYVNGEIVKAPTAVAEGDAVRASVFAGFEANVGDLLGT